MAIILNNIAQIFTITYLKTVIILIVNYSLIKLGEHIRQFFIFKVISVLHVCMCFMYKA